MNIEEKLEIHDCPLCDGGALLEEEGGCGYYVMCLECGCQSVTIDFHSEEERLEAAKKTVDLWNAGKVISCNPGESFSCNNIKICLGFVRLGTTFLLLVMLVFTNMHREYALNILVFVVVLLLQTT